MPDIHVPAPRIDIECRVQYKRLNGEWFTIDGAGEALLVLEGDLVNLLARWTGWFEAAAFDIGMLPKSTISGLCLCCLRDVHEQDHAPDCQYAMSKALIGRGSDE